MIAKIHSLRGVSHPQSPNGTGSDLRVEQIEIRFYNLIRPQEMADMGL